MSDLKMKYIGVVTVLVEMQNLLCKSDPESAKEMAEVLDRIADDFHGIATKLDMQRNGGSRFGIFERHAGGTTLTPYTKESKNE